MKYPHLICLLLCLLPGAALAQRIPDLSLPPDESLRQPDITHQTDQQLMNQNNYGNSYGANTRNPYGNESNMRGQGTAHFIDGYCDPNFRPLIANTPGLAAMQECLDEQKQQSCRTFQGLPPDVKTAISDTIDCRYQANNGAMTAGPEAAPNCGAGDTERMQLLKKYWNDSITAQALVFLPDSVLGISGKCTGTNR